jgi:hypothetical protein
MHRQRSQHIQVPPNVATSAGIKVHLPPGTAKEVKVIIKKLTALNLHAVEDEMRQHPGDRIMSFKGHKW